MKRTHLLAALALALLLAFAVAACALAADVVPLPVDPAAMDTDNGTFRVTVSDIDKIETDGWFTLNLYVEEPFDAEQIAALVPGDTVTVNGRIWTVAELVPHFKPNSEVIESYEVIPEEECWGYVVFELRDDGTCVSLTDDWHPVVHVADKKIMLPLDDSFAYYYLSSGERDEAEDWESFVEELQGYGGAFVPYNTVACLENGRLVWFESADYPYGPENDEEYGDEDEDSGAEEAEGPASGDLVPVWQFCKGRREGLEDAVVTGCTIDCEAGPIPFDVTEEEAADMRQLAINGKITGKANDESLTGGTWVYTFTTPEGEHLLSIEMYRGLIVAVDGMYSFGY